MLDFIPDNVMNLLPAITGAIGVGTGVIVAIPMAIKAVKLYKDAITSLTTFFNKYREFIQSENVRRDFAKVIMSWDDATEYTAKICNRLRMKKTAEFFKNVIREDWAK